jgi:hypothetical protein
VHPVTVAVDLGGKMIGDGAEKIVNLRRHAASAKPCSNI